MKTRNPSPVVAPPEPLNFNLATIQQELLELNFTVYENLERLATELCGHFPVQGVKTLEDSSGLISSLAVSMARQREMLEDMNNRINMIRAQL